MRSSRSRPKHEKGGLAKRLRRAFRSRGGKQQHKQQQKSSRIPLKRLRKPESLPGHRWHQALGSTTRMARVDQLEPLPGRRWHQVHGFTTRTARVDQHMDALGGRPEHAASESCPSE